jgi:hypothetical protein
MKEEIIEAVKVLDVPHAFSEIGAKQRPELLFFCRVYQLQLIKAVENFRGGYSQSSRAATGSKLLD